MKDFTLMTEEAVGDLARQIELYYLEGKYADHRGAVEITQVEVGNLKTHADYYVHFSCEGYVPTNPSGKQFPHHIGTFIGSFGHYKDSVQDLDGEISWGHTFPGAGTTVYLENEKGVKISA